MAKCQRLAGEGCNSKPCFSEKPCLRSRCRNIGLKDGRWEPGEYPREEHFQERGQGKASDLEAAWCFERIAKSHWDWNRNKATKGRTLRDSKKTLDSILSEVGSHRRVLNMGGTYSDLHANSITLCCIVLPY